MQSNIIEVMKGYAFKMNFTVSGNVILAKMKRFDYNINFVITEYDNSILISYYRNSERIITKKYTFDSLESKIQRFFDDYNL
jgi:hypothetical protein